MRAVIDCKEEIPLLYYLSPDCKNNKIRIFLSLLLVVVPCHCVKRHNQTGSLACSSSDPYPSNENSSVPNPMSENFIVVLRDV